MIGNGSSRKTRKRTLNRLNLRAYRIGVLFFGLFVLMRIPACAEEIDRLLAAVNGKVITQGDLDLLRSLHKLLYPDQNLVPASRDAEVDQFIDLELMRQELKAFSLTQEDEGKINTRMQKLRESYAGKGGLPAVLRQFGLQESEVVSFWHLESSIAKFIDFRFRPFVRVSESEIKKYYDEKLIPPLQKYDVKPPALEEASAKIEEILKEERINAALDQWIADIRRNSRIENFERRKPE